MTLHRRIRREIARDDALAESALVGELLSLVARALGARLGARPPALDGLHDELAAIVARSKARARGLNDRRIERRAGGRGERGGLGEHAYGGEHLGAFTSMAALAAAVVDLRGLPEVARAHLDLDGLAAELHVRGEIWSVVEGGVIHAFRRRSAGDERSGAPGERG